MLNLAFILLVAVGVLCFVFRSKERFKEETLSRLEEILSAKANITRSSGQRIRSFSINGKSEDKDVILSVIYEGDFADDPSCEACAVKVTVLLSPEQINKYGAGRGTVSFGEILRGLAGFPASKINAGGLEVMRVYLLGAIFPPGFSDICGLIQSAICKARSI